MSGAIWEDLTPVTTLAGAFTISEMRRNDEAVRFNSRAIGHTGGTCNERYFSFLSFLFSVFGVKLKAQTLSLGRLSCLCITFHISLSVSRVVFLCNLLFGNFWYFETFWDLYVNFWALIIMGIDMMCQCDILNFGASFFRC